MTSFDFDEKNFKINFDKSFDNERVNFDELVKQKLIISLLGDTNSGKSSTINAITGKKYAEVKAIAGSTKEISLYPLSENVIIADTPGLEDINENTSKKASDFVETSADIILLFFNAGSGYQKSIANTYKEIKKLGKPVIVVLNKIDIWYENGILEDYDSYNETIEQIENGTGQSVVPISAKKNINVSSLSFKISQVLETKGKDILFLKNSKYKDESVEAWIKGASISAFGIGVLPVPGADIIPLTALQTALALKIAYIYNCKVTKTDVMSLIGSTITGSAGKQVFKYGIQVLKGLGWLGGPFGTVATSTLAGGVAASITYGFGYASKEYYKSGMTMDLDAVSGVFDSYSKNYKENLEKLK